MKLVSDIAGWTDGRKAPIGTFGGVVTVLVTVLVFVLYFVTVRYLMIGFDGL